MEEVVHPWKALESQNTHKKCVFVLYILHIRWIK